MQSALDQRAELRDHCAKLPFVSSTEGKGSASQFEIAKKNVRLFSVAVFGDNVDLVL
jgi:hypothetical protein